MIGKADGEIQVDEPLILIRCCRRPAAAVGVFSRGCVGVEIVGHRRGLLRMGCGFFGMGCGGGRRGYGSMRLGVDAAAEELALDVSVPVVLDLVVGSSRQPSGNEGPFVTE